MTKIFVNGLSALLGGGQTYLLHLFGEVPEHVEIHLALPDELVPQIQLKPNIRLVDASFAKKSVLHRFLWENWILPRYLRENRIDIYYQPSGILPWVSIKPASKAIAFRNMLPFDPVEIGRFNLGYKRLRYWLLRKFLSRSFQDADLVVFISNYAKSVIDRYLPKRRGKSVTVYHGIDDEFSQAKPKPSGLPGEYVLYVSILNFYKAQVEVVRAWAMVRKRRATREKLVLLGPENPAYAKQVRAEIAKLELQQEVILIPRVPYKDLPGYYHHAKLNLFASSCENCPNILLEKLAAGRPVLSSNYEPMPEIAQTGALYFDPYRPTDLCQLILATIDDSAKLAKMGVEAKEISKNFSWRATREQTWRALLTLGAPRAADSAEFEKR